MSIKEISASIMSLLLVVMKYEEDNEKGELSNEQLDSMLWVINQGLMLITIIGTKLVEMGDDIDMRIG